VQNYLIMKYIRVILLILPFLGFSQLQIGQDIDGEASGDNLGSNVSMSLDGSIVAIGSPFNDGNGSNSGHVRVYENLGGTWTQIGADINGEASDDLSYIISLSSDGSIIAIGGLLNDSNGLDSGHVRIYENLAGTWTQIGTDIDGDAIEDLSGYSVSLSGDGSIVAIGAIENDSNGLNSGHVKIYENLAGIWTQIGSSINGAAAGDLFGNSVSLSGDGSIVAIGGRENDSNGTNSGHVRIYENLAGTWTQIGLSINGDVAGDVSGWSLSLSADGSTVVIGSPFNDGNGDLSGHVRVYENLAGTWTQIGANINGESSGDLAGFSVSLSSDGSILAIGSPVNDDNGLDSGHVRIYENLAGVWTQKGFDIAGESAGDNFGNSVSLSLDGNTIAIGAVFNTGVNGVNSGHVRVYDVNGVLSLTEFNSTLFAMYPNPTKNQFTIQLDNSNVLENINIYNNLGQLVLTSKELMVNTSTLSVGLYVVELETNKGKASKKLIIE
jgi:Flp pilus assembly pilin Flp